MDTFDEKRAQSYLGQPLPDLLDEIALYDTTTRGASDVWQKVTVAIQKPICVEWNWCKVRQDPRFENDYDIYVALVGLLTTRVLNIPLDIDVYLIAAILLKRGLDNFCGCL